jgi:hypothetical protein
VFLVEKIDEAVVPVQLDDYRSCKVSRMPGLESFLARARRLPDLSAAHAQALWDDLLGCVDGVLSARECVFVEALDGGRAAARMDVLPVRRFRLLQGGKG